VPYVRTVKTASGAKAVKVVYSSRRGSRDIEHIGSAHDDTELDLPAGQAVLMAGTGASRTTARDAPRHIPSRCRPGGSRNPSPAGAAGVPVPLGPRSS
jgi:hypothetical protein